VGGVPGGITRPFLVRLGTDSAPLLVRVQHFPAQACLYCGNVTYAGPLSVAVERALEARYQLEGVLPAEVEFETTQAGA